MRKDDSSLPVRPIVESFCNDQNRRSRAGNIYRYLKAATNPQLYLPRSLLSYTSCTTSTATGIASDHIPFAVMAETLEKPFLAAVEANEIEGAILIGFNSKTKQRYEKCIGHRTLLDGTRVPMTPHDILFLASGTKLITTIAALQCCEKGLLSLDQDLRPKYFSDSRVIVKWDEDDKEPTYDDVRNPLTLRHLLTHSSGAVYHYFHPLVLRWRNETPMPEGKTLSPLTRFKQPLAFQPGEGWMYGCGLDLAGAIIEDVTGMRLDTFFRQNILEPLGVAREDFTFAPVREGMGDRMVDMNPKDTKGEGLSVGMGNSVHLDGDESLYGGHGGYATAAAYEKVLESVLLDDGKLLSHDSVQQMFTPQLEDKAKAKFNEILATPPMNSFFSQDTTSGNRDYGLSGVLVTEENDGSGLGKGSLTWGGGVNSAWFIDRANGVCGFAAPQMGMPPQMHKAMELKKVFRKEMKCAL